MLLFVRFATIILKMSKNNFLPRSIQNTRSLIIQKVKEKELTLSKEDIVAVEEPLEINIVFGKVGSRKKQNISVTMRTPDESDFDLAVGFLFTEGIINASKDITQVRYTASELDEISQTNVVTVELNPNVVFDLGKLNRHFYTSSSCGVCGKSSIEMVQTVSCYSIRKNFPKVESEIFYSLPDKLRAAQENFNITGAIHAAALFDTQGNLLDAKEDVGRHNALDKLIGAALNKNLLPLSDKILLVSGRTSFELIQKASMAGIPIVAAVGAPSSLAVELAEENNMTLIGFLRGKAFNIYAGSSRLLE